ncbi:hypothetical protein QQ045_033139 [Rhodiola kirilowii]
MDNDDLVMQLCVNFSALQYILLQFQVRKLLRRWTQNEFPCHFELLVIIVTKIQLNVTSFPSSYRRVVLICSQGRVRRLMCGGGYAEVRNDGGEKER